MLRLPEVLGIAIASIVLSACEKPAPVRNFNGQVFVTLNSRETIKLSLVEVRICETSHAANTFTSAVNRIWSEIAKEESKERTLRNRTAELESAIQLNELAQSGLGWSIKDANNKVSDIQENVQKLREIRRSDLNALTERVLSLKAFSKSNGLVLEDTKLKLEALKSDLNAALKGITNSLVNRSDLTNAAAALIYASQWKPFATLTTDADGQFRFETSLRSNFSAVAVVERSVISSKQWMVWVLPLSDKEPNLLHNDNAALILNEAKNE